MESVIVCELVKDPNSPLSGLVEKTYNESFPEVERRDFSLVRKLLVEDSRFELLALSRDGVYVGFITAWQFDGFVYAEHFAVDPSARNGGIGSRAMRSFLALHKDPVVLEVEMPTDEMSRRRIGFYERLGFVLDTHTYQQPPYRPGDGWFEMRLMTYGSIHLSHSVEQVRDTIYRNVYGVVR